MLPKVELCDLISLQRGTQVTHNKLVNIRGCNGSGKSTIPIAMLESDNYAFELVWHPEGNKERVLATVFPSYNYAAIGHYHSKCGGMDSIKTTDDIKTAVKIMWNFDYNIIMEGIMASTVRQTYIDLFLSLNEENYLVRDIIIYNLLPPLEVCLQRIQARNGGKPIKEELVRNKMRMVENNVQHFKNAGFKSLKVSNEDIDKDKTLEWFFDQIKQVESHEVNSKNLETLHVEPKDSLKGYEWFEWYKEPNDGVKFNQKYLDGFWKFIYERLEIYYKRVVLQQPAPWTDDSIFNTYRFTNICRDMDKLSLYERKNILSKLDEPVADLLTRKKSVIFNVILFRTFVKVDTYECFGFIDFSEPSWKKQWSVGKKSLLKRREQGLRNFTGSFMVNTLKRCNPDESTRDNQTLNALCMCEWFISNLDEFYDKAFIQSKNMKEQLEYLVTLDGIGSFTAYEFACSFAMVSRYYKNVLVDWTQDSYTSIGPGSSGGIDWVFKSLGNLSKVESIIYLRSIWKHEMKRLGLYDKFIQMLPEVLENDLDLRIIEHCLCESHKYHKLKTKTGRTKQRFTPETTDLKTLIV